MTAMRDIEHRPVLHLLPGESHVARRPLFIRTILGSCIGATFWSARLGVGAVCHSGRCVDLSIRELVRRFDALGVGRGEIQVKLFGGADVLPVSGMSSRPTVGARNCEAALEVVEAEGLVVVTSSLGGISGRDVRFDTGSGEVLVRRVVGPLSRWSRHSALPC